MFCYKCGKEINEESHFCKYCGTEQMTYKSAKPDDNNCGWITKISLNKLIHSTAFKIYILLLGFWSISWINDWFYLDTEEYISLSIAFFVIVPLIVHWWVAKWIKDKIKSKKQ